MNASDFAPETFAALQAAWQTEAQRSDWLGYAALSDDARLGPLVQGQLYPVADGYRSLLLLRGVAAPDQLAARFPCPTDGSACWVDLKRASETLVERYQERFLWLLLALAALLPLLLWVLTGSLQRALWCVGTLSGAVLGSAGLSSLLHGSLSLFELVGLTLVAGLGLDYALFYSRLAQPLTTSEPAETRSAVALCALSSLLVFGVLSLSSIPLLRGLGSTVALGVLLAYLLARFGVRPPASGPAPRG